MFRTERLGGGNDVSIWRNEKTRYMLLLSFVPVLCGVSFTSVERGGKGALVKRVRNGKAWLFVWKMMYSACISQISFSYVLSARDRRVGPWRIRKVISENLPYLTLLHSLRCSLE